MEKLFCTTSTDGETYFYIDILETGWIYDVFLILTYEVKTKFEDEEYIKVKANYAGKTVIEDRTYSRFEAFYKFDKPADFMASYFMEEGPLQLAVVLFTTIVLFIAFIGWLIKMENERPQKIREQEEKRKVL